MTIESVFDIAKEGESFSLISCGVHLLHGCAEASSEDGAIQFLKCATQTPKVFDYGSREFTTDALRPHNYPCAMFVFSDAEINGGGLNVAKYIRDHNLGDLVKSPVRRNPNSRNLIRTWIWCPDVAALTTWSKEHGFKMQRKY